MTLHPRDNFEQLQSKSLNPNPDFLDSAYWGCVQCPTCGWLTDKPDHDEHDSYGWEFCQENHFGRVC